MPDYRSPGHMGRKPSGMKKGMAQDQGRESATTKNPMEHMSLEHNPFTAKMEAPGVTGTAGAAMTSSNPVGKKVAETPEQLATPDVVSATDPAYSMHPIARALAPLMGQGMAPGGALGAAALPPGMPPGPPPGMPSGSPPVGPGPGMPMPGMMGQVQGTPWQQLGPEFLGKNMTQAQLLAALGHPGLGLDWGIKTQGEAI